MRVRARVVPLSERVEQGEREGTWREKRGKGEKQLEIPYQTTNIQAYTATHTVKA